MNSFSFSNYNSGGRGSNSNSNGAGRGGGGRPRTRGRGGFSGQSRGGVNSASFDRPHQQQYNNNNNYNNDKRNNNSSNNSNNNNSSFGRNNNNNSSWGSSRGRSDFNNRNSRGGFRQNNRGGDGFYNDTLDDTHGLLQPHSNDNTNNRHHNTTNNNSVLGGNNNNNNNNNNNSSFHGSHTGGSSFTSFSQGPASSASTFPLRPSTTGSSFASAFGGAGGSRNHSSAPVTTMAPPPSAFGVSKSSDPNPFDGRSTLQQDRPSAASAAKEEGGDDGDGDEDYRDAEEDELDDYYKEDDSYERDMDDTDSDHGGDEEQDHRREAYPSPDGEDHEGDGGDDEEDDPYYDDDEDDYRDEEGEGEEESAFATRFTREGDGDGGNDQNEDKDFPLDDEEQGEENEHHYHDSEEDMEERSQEQERHDTHVKEKEESHNHSSATDREGHGISSVFSQSISGTVQNPFTGGASTFASAPPVGSSAQSAFGTGGAVKRERGEDCVFQQGKAPKAESAFGAAKAAAPFIPPNLHEKSSVARDSSFQSSANLSAAGGGMGASSNTSTGTSSTANPFNLNLHHSTVAPLSRPPVHGGQGSALCYSAQLFRRFLNKALMPPPVTEGKGSYGQGAASASPHTRESCWRELQDLFFGPVGLYGDFQHTVADMQSVCNQVLQVVQPSSGKGSHQEHGRLWVQVVALGCQLNWMLQGLGLTEPFLSPESTQLLRNRRGGPAPLQGAESAAEEEDEMLDGIVLPVTEPERESAERYLDGLCDNEEEALVDVCLFANQLAQLLRRLYESVDPLPPFCVLTVVLRRVRLSFTEARAAGSCFVQTNLLAIARTLYKVLNPKVAPLYTTGAVPSSAQEPLVFSFASLAVEFFMNGDWMSELEQFAAYFHKTFPHALEERCALHYAMGSTILLSSLTRPKVEAALDYFNKALAAFPSGEEQRGAPHGQDAHGYYTPYHEENKLMVQLKLEACSLALGRGCVGEKARVTSTALLDVAAALHTANLALYDRTMEANAVYYVETGIHNVLSFARQRLLLLMVVRFYLHKKCHNIIPLLELAAFCADPSGDSATKGEEPKRPYALDHPTVAAITLNWLLPLLVDKQINGVIAECSLVLSKANPFDDYEKVKLEAAAL